MVIAHSFISYITVINLKLLESYFMISFIFK